MFKILAFWIEIFGDEIVLRFPSNKGGRWSDELEV